MSGFRYFTINSIWNGMLLVIVIVVLGACTSTKVIVSCPVQPVGQYKYSVEDNGIAIALRPFYRTEETIKYFGDDFYEARIIALQVIAENKSDSKSFLISKEHFSLNFPTGKADPVLKKDTGELWMLAPLLPIFTPFALSSHQAASDSQMVKHNFDVRKLQLHTLSPGDIIDGFIYVGVPKGMKNYPKRFAVTANIKELPSGDLLPIKFNLLLD